MVRVISPFEKVTDRAAGRASVPGIFEKAPGDRGEKTKKKKSLSLSVSHASLAVSFHFTSLQNCIILFFTPLAEFPFVISHTFPSSYFSLTVYKVQLRADPLFLAVFMWQRPDLLKAGALTKERTNDRERCQSNTQAFQTCKQMCACTKGALQKSFQRRLFSLHTHQPHAYTSLYFKDGSCVPHNSGSEAGVFFKLTFYTSQLTLPPLCSHGGLWCSCQLLQ